MSFFNVPICMMVQCLMVRLNMLYTLCLARLNNGEQHSASGGTLQAFGIY